MNLKIINSNSKERNEFGVYYSENNLKFVVCDLFLIFRSGVYEIQEAEGVPIGTKIVVHLKTDCREFSDNDTVQSM